MIPVEDGSCEITVRIAHDGTPYIPNISAQQQIVANVRKGHYSTILGSRFTEKCLLLHDVKGELQRDSHFCSIILDLATLDKVPADEFLTRFALLVAQQLKSEHRVAGLPSPSEVTDALTLQHFLEDCLQQLQQDLVLLIYRLECIRIGPIKSLLLSLRAVHNSTPTHEPYRLGVVAASSLSVADLSLGPTSPFNIARVIWVENLNAQESEHLIKHLLEAQSAHINDGGKQRLIEAADGGRYLLPRICAGCVKLVFNRVNKTVTVNDVNTAIEIFMGEDAKCYEPFREMVQSLQSDCTNLLNVLRLLDEGPLSRRQLKLDLSADVDDLLLTGAVCAESVGDEKTYRIRNEIYAEYLHKQFPPDRVVRVLNSAGQWEQAIEYLERVVTQQPAYRSTLLDTVIESIYGTADRLSACRHVAKALSLAFQVQKARVYLFNPFHAKLNLVSHVGFEEPPEDCIYLTESGRIEVMVYHSQDYQVVPDVSGEQILLYSLGRDRRHPAGLIAIHDYDADPQSADFLGLQSFFDQLNHAFGVVIDRELTITQFSILHQTGQQVTSSLDLEKVLESTVHAAVKAVPLATIGLLFLWDEEVGELVLRKQIGYRENIGELLRFKRGEGYTGWVFDGGEPHLLPDVLKDPKAKRFTDPDLNQDKSAISVPLEAWGRIIGVLNLECLHTLNAFEEKELKLLETLGAQAAIAIQNAYLHRELYKLGMSINSGELAPEQIFQEVVKSITRVSAAFAANLLLFDNVDDPAAKISARPLLSRSSGLGGDYNDKINPRPDGLTAHVLHTGLPASVSHPDEGDGINQLAYDRGVRAYLCLPLTIQNRIIGILFVHYNKPHIFSDNEVHMLSLYANQAALALENARQREQIQMTEAVVLEWHRLFEPDPPHHAEGGGHQECGLGAAKLAQWLARRGTALGAHCRICTRRRRDPTGGTISLQTQRRMHRYKHQTQRGYAAMDSPRIQDRPRLKQPNDG